MANNKILMIAICAIGFLIPVGIATISVGMSNLSIGDPGLPKGFKPVGDLTVYYVGGG